MPSTRCTGAGAPLPTPTPTASSSPRLGARQRPPGPLPAPRRAAHRVPVRLPARPVAFREHPRVIDDALEQAATVGAPARGCSPTTTFPPAPSPVTPAHSPTTWSKPTGSGPAGRSRSRTTNSAGVVPAPPRCCSWRCRAPHTSTRVRNSDWKRSRTFPTRPVRIRRGSRPASPTAAGTAAGFRSRGRTTRCRTASPRSTRRRTHGFRSRNTGPRTPRKRRPATPESFLTLYREALELRRDFFDTPPHPVEWLDTPPRDVLAFARGAVQCWVNTGTEPVALPPEGLAVVLGSVAGITGGVLPSDAAVWLSEPGAGESR